MQEVMANILPDPRGWEITWSRWNTITWTESTTEYPGPTPKTTPRMVVAGIFTLATLTGAYTGTEWVVAFPVAALVYTTVSSTMVPNRSIRSTLKWMVAIQVSLSTYTSLKLMGQATVAAFTGLLMGGFWVYKLYFPTDATKPKSSDPQPSQEVLLLMMMFSATVPLVVSGYLVCCNQSLYTMDDR